MLGSASAVKENNILKKQIMKVTKVLIDFSTTRYSDSELNLLALKVGTKMTGNAKFPTPYPAGTPALTDLATAQTDFQTALLASNGDKEQTMAKNQKRAVLTKILQKLAVYVNTASDGDVAMMLSSGFAVSKQPSPVGPLPKPTNFKVVATSVGTLQLSVDVVDGASTYHWELQRVGSTDPMVSRSTTTADETVTGLVSLQQYTCKVVAIGADKTTRTYSDPITASVL